VRADAHGWVLRTFESCAGSDAMADYAGISAGHSTLTCCFPSEALRFGRHPS
jgi:hypothetical protein